MGILRSTPGTPVEQGVHSNKAMLFMFYDSLLVVDTSIALFILQFPNGG